MEETKSGLSVKEKEVSNVLDNLPHAFIWGNTKEGHKYWERVMWKLVRIRDLK
jgi:hypothetical protein